MAYAIRMGRPDMEAFWNDFSSRCTAGKLKPDEEKLFKKLVKTLRFLETDPRHNSLSSHEIDELSRKCGMKVFQSYLENHTPSAGRLFWAYGPNRGEITILAIEPHPEDKKRGAYERIKLSSMDPPAPRGKTK